MNSLQIDTSTCRLAKRFSAEYNYSESMHCFSVHVGKHCYNPFCNKNPFCNNLLQNGLGEHYYNSGRQLQPVL